MKKLILVASLLLTAAPLFAEEEHLEEGLVTSLINKAITKHMPEEEPSDTLRYGRHVSDWVSAPRFGAFLNSAYKYSTNAATDKGFMNRMLRMYVDGTVLRHFAYRIQLEGTPPLHLKDLWMEWQQYSFLRIKVGQMKRIFLFENPTNPWEVGVGDYSQATKKLAGFNDYSCEENTFSNGGADIGLQLQGDLLPVGADCRKLLHYQVGVFNGQGGNQSDANRHKDVMGMVQVNPVEGLNVAVFGWKGNIEQDGMTVSRNRWALSGRFQRKDWTVRAEYAHHVGHRTSDYDAETRTWAGNARADAWYMTAGAPLTPWLKLWAKYDAYRDDATWATLKSIYSLCPNFQIHRHIMFQAQYNYVHDRSGAPHDYHELWAMTYIRF